MLSKSQPSLTDVQHNTTQRNATQRNATQRNATQRNATQRNTKMLRQGCPIGTAVLPGGTVYKMKVS